MSIRLAIWSLLLIPTLCSAQGLEIGGRVVDAETGKPLPFANLQIEHTRLGTSTNAEGYFSLFVPSEAKKANLLVSYIGYQLYKTQIALVPSIIRLAQESRQLNEVVVMPDSSLLVFLREAYQRIEKNYATEPYQLKGFYRESLKLTKGDYYYFGEAELLAQGSGYQYNRERGSVKVLKSRISHFASADSIRAVLYYGGPFVAVSNDMIKNRLELLRPDRKNYHYQLVDIAKNLGKEVWVISFEKKDSTIRGKLFVERDSKAYVRTEVTRFYRDSINQTSFSRIQDVRTEVRNTYVKEGDRWFLSYTGIEKRQINSQLDKATTIAAEFSTQEIFSDTLARITFKDELEYTSIFSQLQNNFDRDFWKGSSTLVPDSSLQAQMKPLMANVDRQLTSASTAGGSSSAPGSAPGDFERLQRMVNVLTRISSGFGFQFLPVSVQGTNLQLQYPNPNRSLSFPVSSGGREFPILFSGESAFRINKRLQSFVALTSDLTKQYEFRSTSIGLRYNFKINRRGNPVMFRPSLAYGSMLMGVGSDVFENPGDFMFDGKRVRDDRLRFYTGEQTNFLRPSFSLAKKLRSIRWIYLDIGYYIKFRQQNMLFLRDESGFVLFRKFRKSVLEDTEAVLTQDGTPVTSQNLNWFNALFLEAGFRWSF